MADDEATQETNDDAAACKLSAINLGYWADPYLNCFIKPGVRRAPEINIGYYIRVHGIRSLAKQFIQTTNKECQIINLGAGFDTNYWLLKEENLAPQKFIEVDFPTVTAKKIYKIKCSTKLRDTISNDGNDIKLDRIDLHGPDYHIIGADLRKLDEFQAKLAECSLDPKIPTLVMAECVLVYMDPDKSEALLRWLTSTFDNLFFINYEQVNMRDNFGAVMVQNLKSRNMTLSGIHYCTSLETQKDRFTSTGWHGAYALDMNAIHQCLPQNDVQRMEMIERLDEKELVQQLCAHYCMTSAFKDTNNIGLNKISLLENT